MTDLGAVLPVLLVELHAVRLWCFSRLCFLLAYSAAVL
jgi:hypothetical protein